jgi:hypothetical protein
MDAVYWHRTSSKLIRNIDIEKANYRTPLLSVTTHTMCSSVSVVSIITAMVLTSFLCVSAATWPVFFTGWSSADYSWHAFTRNWVYGMENYDARHSSLLETTPTTHHHTVYYRTCWYQFSKTVCPTFSVTCTFRYKHSSADQLRFFRITKLCLHMYIFIHVHHS